MRSYLSLVPISARVHKRRNRMTLLCIIISVFLVTTVFSMADMAYQSEKSSMLAKHGNWHIQLMNVPESTAEQIKARSDISVLSWHDIINEDRTDAYYIGEKKAVLHGMDEVFMTEIWDCLSEGSLPQNDGEIVLSPNAKEILGIEVGGSVCIDGPSGSTDYTVCGFGENDAEFNRLYDTVSVYMNKTAFYKFSEQNGAETAPTYYVRFQEHANIRRHIADIETEYALTDENIDENTAILGLTGFSSNSYIRNIYPGVIVLILLIMIAGVLMISGSMNSNVAERSQFFGMLRCIGASRKQIMRIVRLEALNWCKTAVPAGVLLGTLSTWGLCFFLRFCIGGEFLTFPLFSVSVPGIVSGVLVGFVTVLFAAHSPARCAARVSPVEAVAGNVRSISNVRHALNLNFFGIENALGIHHAVSARKNLFLMTGSFALSIILFLAFSTILNFFQTLLPNLRPWQPDFTITSEDGSNSVDRSLADEISRIPGVKHVYGNMASIGVPVSSDKGIDQVTLVSYDEYLMHYTKDSRIEGDLSKVSADSNEVLTIYNNDNPLEIGDRIQLYGDTVEIAGVISDGLFSDGIAIICSEETFMRLTGDSDYGILNVQFADNASDENLDSFRSLISSQYVLSDYRKSNLSNTAEYWVLRTLVYSFLAVIALITVLNIMNSTSMSVSARMKQYGIMRAVGMDERQLTRMVAAEVFTFALSGSVVGCVAGLLIHKFLFYRLITAYFGTPWKLPVFLLIVILSIVFASVAAAIYAPAKRIRSMSITDTINEL